jgi:hypothetical protein
VNKETSFRYRVLRGLPLGQADPALGSLAFLPRQLHDRSIPSRTDHRVPRPTSPAFSIARIPCNDPSQDKKPCGLNYSY